MMTQRQIIDRCTTLRANAEKFHRFGMVETYIRTVDEHNALAHSFNRKSKRMCLTFMEVTHA